MWPSFDGAKIGPDESAGRYPDGGSKIDVLSAPTPGLPNAEPGSGPPEGEFIRADANSDGRVNVTDMSFILKVLFHGGDAPACEDRLDADDNGAIEVTDALAIGNALFRDGPAFPPPYPDEGTDPTPDSLPCPAE